MPQAPVTGDVATPLAWALLQCLCSLLNDPDGPYTSVCRCAWRHSNTEPPADVCCTCDAEGTNGEAWIRLVSTARVQMAQRDGSVRWTGQRDITFQFGVYRCLEAVPDRSGPEPVMPSAAQNAHDAALMAADAYAMEQAVFCCDAVHDGSKSLLVAVAGWVAAPNLGGCGGGTYTFTVRK